MTTEGIIGYILLCGSLGLPVIFGGIAYIDSLIPDYKSYNYKKLYNSLIQKTWAPYDKFDTRWEAEKYKIEVMNMAQLSFEQWISFYNTKPEDWYIEKKESGIFADIPYYTRIEKNKIVFIPIFWTNWKEMKKYRYWVENHFEIGDAQIYSNQRDADLNLLVGYLREDIKERKDEFQKQIDELKKELKY